MKPCLRQCEILHLHLWTRSLTQRSTQRGSVWIAGWDLDIHLTPPPQCEWLRQKRVEPLAGPTARDWLAISSLRWHLLAFKRDVHLSSSLINNYSWLSRQALHSDDSHGWGSEEGGKKKGREQRERSAVGGGGGVEWRLNAKWVQSAASLS